MADDLSYESNLLAEQALRFVSTANDLRNIRDLRKISDRS